MSRFAIAVLACLLLKPALANAEHPNASEEKRPNILYFYVDDMGWGSIGPNGQAQRKADGKPYVRTPTLNRLAAEGINFRRGYGCHVCSPARSSQQSGFHQGHTFADRNDPNNAKKAMRADDILMGDALSKAGYVTGYWGKWGYGGSKDKNQPTIDNVQTLPTSHGYTHVLAELHHVRAHTFFQPTLWSAPAKANAVGGLELVPNSMQPYQNNKAYPNTPALQNNKKYPATAYCDDSYAFAALDFVREQSQNYNKTGQPFFGLLAVQIPHAPFDEISELPSWNKVYKDDPAFSSLAPQTQQWAAMVSRIDAHFGNILAALDDPNNDGDTSDSVAANTLVIFQSDNGGPAGKNNIELDANGGLRGNKGKIQEGGIRVPLVMRWPTKIHQTSKIKAGSNIEQVVDVTDLLPTFCDLAGAETPLGIDGVSIAPMLSGEGVQRKREFIIHEAGNGQSIIRGNQKLIRPGKKGALQLFDLEKDHGEENDIADSNPELVKELEALLLGERVDEPRGFSNTYHHWTGDDNAKTSMADNWSDYVYSNAGITYQTDDGPPQLSWIAAVANDGDSDKTAVVDQDLNVLGLVISGNAEKKATQSLVVSKDGKVHGRNEVRVNRNGILYLSGGTVESLRWLEVQNGGVVVGSGKINATVYNNGKLKLTGTGSPAIHVASDFHQSESGELSVNLSDNKSACLLVDGTANLGGQLMVTFEEHFVPVPNATYTILRSKQRIEGSLSNSNGVVQLHGGKQLEIIYNETDVQLRLK